MIVLYVLNCSAFYSQTWYAGWRFPITSEKFWLPKQNKFTEGMPVWYLLSRWTFCTHIFLYWRAITRKNIQQNVSNFVSPQNFKVKVTGRVSVFTLCLWAWHLMNTCDLCSSHFVSWLLCRNPSIKRKWGHTDSTQHMQSISTNNQSLSACNVHQFKQCIKCQ